MEPKEGPSFDVMLGGSVEVASSFSLREFGTPRIEEILMLSEALNEPPAKGQLFQRLPKHMRRRQMSHHESRLPRRLRSTIPTQSKDPPTKRPSRKYRRKPSNLLTEYSRRQRTKIWLETHVWHAKRFHMVDRWGYRLPDTSTNKGFRANYRAVRSHCLLIDMSYLACVELAGPESELLAGLQPCCNKACGLTFAARTYTDGLREGSLVMYHPNAYPYKAIGHVSFLWKPKTSDSNRVLWLWVHPSFHEEVVECLKVVFNLDKSSVLEDACSIPKWTSNTITLSLLKDRLNRFRLVGPLSSCVISDALTVAPLPKPDNSNVDDSVVVLDIEKSVVEGEESVIEIPSSSEMDVDNDPRKEDGLEKSLKKLEEARVALLDLYNREGWGSSWQQQNKIAARLTATPPSQFQAGVVLGMLVTDPRLSTPGQRTKSTGSAQVGFSSPWNANLAVSALWEQSVRSSVTNSLLTDWQVSQIRAKSAVAQSVRGPYGAAVPLILIQQPGCRGNAHNGLGAGWDIIVPSGWSLPVWRGLILRGARTGGLRETSLLRLETGTVCTALQPDTQAGRTEAENLSRSLQEAYFKRPPAKRPNYIKLGVSHPFTTPWGELCGGDVFVVRDIRLLQRLAEALDQRKTVELEDVAADGGSLVAISVQCSEGRPEPLARLHVPEETDWEKQLEEPVHVDRKNAERKEFRKNHLKLLRQWRRDRKRAKQGTDPVWKDEEVKKLRQSAEEFRRRSWLPELPPEPLRVVAGYVTQADFRHSEGCGAAQGYVTLRAFLQALQMASKLKKTPALLLRNVRHSRYHRAEFRVIVD